MALLLAALTVGHLALIPADGSVITLGVVLFVAGTAIAPAESAVSAMVEGAAPDGTVTEAFAWLATSMAVGGAVGAAAAGMVADSGGPAAAFAAAGGAGALAVLACVLRLPTIATPNAAANPGLRRRPSHIRGSHKAPALCSRPVSLGVQPPRAGHAARARRPDVHAAST